MSTKSASTSNDSGNTESAAKSTNFLS